VVIEPFTPGRMSLTSCGEGDGDGSTTGAEVAVTVVSVLLVNGKKHANANSTITHTVITTCRLIGPPSPSPFILQLPGAGWASYFGLTLPRATTPH